MCSDVFSMCEFVASVQFDGLAAVCCVSASDVAATLVAMRCDVCSDVLDVECRVWRRDELCVCVNDLPSTDGDVWHACIGSVGVAACLPYGRRDVL